MGMHPGFGNPHQANRQKLEEYREQLQKQGSRILQDLKTHYLKERHALLTLLLFLINRCQNVEICSQSLIDFVDNKLVKKKLTENLTLSLVRIQQSEYKEFRKYFDNDSNTAASKEQLGKALLQEQIEILKLLFV